MRTVIIAASAAAALFSSPAFAQQPSESTASIPEFYGIWAHLTFPDVEPPLSGAGSVRNLSRVTIEAARTLNPYNGTTTDGASPGVRLLRYADLVTHSDCISLLGAALHGRQTKTNLPISISRVDCTALSAPL
jgi:hypothetical protein